MVHGLHLDENVLFFVFICHLCMKEKDYPIFAMRFKSPDSETNQDGETRLFLVSMKNKYSRN